jgi:Na+:H+ antiporter, NhaA family
MCGPRSSETVLVRNITRRADGRLIKVVRQKKFTRSRPRLRWRRRDTRHFRKPAVIYCEVAGDPLPGYLTPTLAGEDGRRDRVSGVLGRGVGSALDSLQQFLKLESAGGIALCMAAALALVLANSPLQALYVQLLEVPIAIQVGGLVIAKPLLLWVNDGLMAVFFMLVGLEIKREVVEGELSRGSSAALPAIAALGGMAGPALVYLVCNWGDAAALRGWAIPTATDIAFALAVLALLGPRVPASLKIFLLALAIIDDLGAIVIIAIFYTAELSLIALLLAGFGVATLVLLNLCGVSRRAAYTLTGIFIWVCVLKSGIHATLAGVVTGLALPLRSADGSTPARDFEHDLHPWVAFGVLPLFAFANAGVRLAGIALSDLVNPIQIGTELGLLLGKQAGVIGAIWLATRIGLARLPEGSGWLQVYGVALLTGIGFTMSLFIGTLAFPAEAYDTDVRLAVLLASLVSAICGYLVLRIAADPGRRAERTRERWPSHEIDTVGRG